MSRAPFAPSAAKREREVPEQMQRLSIAISDLDKVLTELQGRLASGGVLTPEEPPPPPGTGATSSTPSTPLAIAILTNRTAVQVICLRMQQLLDHLEV